MTIPAGEGLGPAVIVREFITQLFEVIKLIERFKQVFSHYFSRTGQMGVDNEMTHQGLDKKSSF